MEKLREIVLITCCLSFLCSILNAIKPNERFDRQIKLMLSCVLTLGILTPLIQGISSLDFSEDLNLEEETNLSASVSTQTAQVAAENLEQTLTASLEEQGMNGITANVTMYISDSGSIEIEQIDWYDESGVESDEETMAQIWEVMESLGIQVQN
ncbi:MAG: stage III sporulation protein AF [Ruminococcus sp.]|nr:stage III sporulation protein AF [Ruminococcus sp.]